MNPKPQEPPRLFPTLRCQDPDAMMRRLTYPPMRRAWPGV